MRRRTSATWVLVLAATAASCGRGALATPAKPRMLGELPLAFAPNTGQTDAEVAYVAHGRDATVFLTADGAVLAGATGAVRLRPMKANPAPLIEPRAALPGKANYFLGRDPSRWRSNLPTFAQIAYRDVWPGVDWLCRGTGSTFEYDFVVAPGADASRIAVEIDGAHGLRVDERGDLRIRLDRGEVVQRRPVVYEIAPDGRREIEARCVVVSERVVAFDVGPRDPGRTLVIDPVVSYDTFLGGADDDYAHAIDHDAIANLYVGGSTKSSDFPFRSGYDTTYNASFDAFVAKLDPTGATVLFATYVGGSDSDGVNAMKADATGVWIAGTSFSGDYPVTSGVLSTSKGAGADGVISKLSADGASLVVSSYLGANSTITDSIAAIDVDATGVYVAGVTGPGFTTTAGVVQATHPGAGTDVDGFVEKLDLALTARVYATLLAGTAPDSVLAIAVDGDGSVCAAGRTQSSDFPTQSAAQSAFGGNEDAFVVRLSADATARTFATFFGGIGVEQAYGLALVPVAASPSDVVVVGLTRSSGMTLTSPFQATYGGGTDDAFVTRYSSAGALQSSSFLGGSGSDIAYGVTRADDGRLWVVGATASTNFPAPAADQGANGGGYDGFLVRLTSTASSQEYGSYVGGTNDEFAYDVFVTTSNRPFVVGVTASSNFPTTAGAPQTAFGGVEDAFIASPHGADGGGGGGGTTVIPPVFLPGMVIAKINPQFPGLSTISASGIFDPHTIDPGLTLPETLDVGGLHFAIPGLTAAKPKRYAHSADGLTLSIAPGVGGTSKGTFKLKYVGDLQSLGGLDGPLTLRFANARFDATATVTLTKGKFKLAGPHLGLLEPCLFPQSVAAGLKTAGKHTLTVVLGLAPNGAVPTAASDLRFRFGTLDVTIPASSFGPLKKGRFTSKGEVGGITSVVVDYAKRTITVKAKNLDLGAFTDGANSVTIGVKFGTEDLEFTTSLAKKGTSLKY